MNSNEDFEKDDSRDSYRLQGKVSKSIYERVMRIREESGQTVNSIVHQMVIHSLPHFESLYFPQTPANLALDLLKDPSARSFFGSLFSDSDVEPQGEFKDQLDLLAGQIKAEKPPNT